MQQVRPQHQPQFTNLINLSLHLQNRFQLLYEIPLPVHHRQQLHRGNISFARSVSKDVSNRCCLLSALHLWVLWS